jgi:hypothetical protein
MLLRRISTASAFYAATVFAGPVNFNGADANLKLDYRAALTHEDNQMTKVTGAPKPGSTSSIGLQEIGLNLFGKINDSADFDFKYGFVSSELLWGHVTLKANEMISVRMGSDTTNIGGWENIQWVIDQPYQSTFLSHMLPLAATADLVDIMVDSGFGIVSLQFTDDANGFYNKKHNKGRKKQPTWLFEYTGNFDGIMPLVQYGQFDSNHSNIWTVGVAADIAGANVALDYTTMTVAYRDEAANKEQSDVTTAAAFMAGYDVGGFKPWVKYTMHDVKQAGTDAKANANQVPSETDATQMRDAVSSEDYHAALANDNGSTMGLGVHVTQWGEGYIPYVQYVTHSGKFLKAGSADQTETKSDTHIEVGILGSF